MLHSLQSNARRLAAETRGAEIAEAAAVLPLMFMMLLGIFWFGQAFSIYGAITRAAQEGARAGAVPICATCPVTNSSATNSANAVQAALVASKLDPSQAKATPPVTFSPCPGQIVAVVCAATGNPVMTTAARVCVTTHSAVVHQCRLKRERSFAGPPSPFNTRSSSGCLLPL